MSRDEAELMAYLDGELDELRRRAMETRLATDPALQRRVTALRGLSTQLRRRFDGALVEPVPDRLLEAAGSLAMALDRSRMVARRRGYTPQSAGWWAAAASLVLGVFLGYQFSTKSSLPASVGADASGRLVAQGALARALDQRLAADPAPAGAPHPVISFIAHSGEYCRTFTGGSGAASLVGLACREGDVWQVRVMESQAQASGDAGSFRQAASALSPAIVQTVQSLMRDTPLDAAGETRARAQGWH